MAKGVEPTSLGAWEPASDRCEALLSLWSLVVLIFSIRHMSGPRHVLPESESESEPQPEAKAATTASDGETEGKQKEQTTKDKKTTTPKATTPSDTPDPPIPGGIVCVVLMLASVLIQNVQIFQATGSSKGGKAAALTGPLGALAKSADKAKSVATKGRGPLQQVHLFVETFLSDDEGFKVAHGLLMVSGLIVAVLTAFGATATGYFQRRGGRGRGRDAALSVVVFALIFAVFGMFRVKALSKLWRGLDAEGLLPAVQMFLRIGGLVAATSRGASHQGGTPVFFVVLQLASLIAPVARQNPQELLAPFVKAWQSNFDVLWDTASLAQIVPMFLATIYLYLKHFMKTPEWIVFAIMLAFSVSPPALFFGVPYLANLVGVKGGMPQTFINFLSILEATAAGSLFVAGGPVTMLGAVLMMNLLAQIHGQEGIARLFTG
eukprot:TRINITY_DN29383_c0_g1_i1.p1 TRINITY_DN29383_c0_g1~~TRINITY_DN29383_c0_g1_i1.p1  ORF type:complete len:435 (+),score=60.87 TRINITY_DN29383_c0_g1_i1:88-1392(+)